MSKTTKQIAYPVRGPLARRRFIGRAAIAVGSAAAAALPTAARAQNPLVLRFQGAWSAHDVYHDYALDYARRVDELTGGRVRIEVLPGGAVVKPTGMLEAVNKGVLDGCHGVTRLWHSRSPAASLFGGAPMPGMSADDLLAWMEYGGGKALYAELFAQVLSPDVIPFLYGPIPAQPLGWFRQPLAGPGQLKGLKIRATGLAAELFRELGAEVVALGDEEAAAALSSGAVGGVQRQSLASDRESALPAAAATVMLQSYHRPAEAFEVLFNRARYEALPRDLQLIVRLAGQAASADLSWKAAERNARAYAELRGSGRVRFTKTTNGVLRAQAHAWSVIAARHGTENPLFRKVLDSQVAWLKRALEWRRAALVDPGAAYDHWFGRRSAAARSKGR